MTTLEIDGKEYCVETLFFEVQRLKREVIAAEEYRKLELRNIKAEIEEKCHGLSTNVDDPYDEHEIVFLDEVLGVIDNHINIGGQIDDTD